MTVLEDVAEFYGAFARGENLQPTAPAVQLTAYMAEQDSDDAARSKAQAYWSGMFADGLPRLELLGVLMTMFDARTNLSQQVVGEVRQHFGDLVFETVIPRTTRLAEAPSFGKPIIYYDKYSAGAAAYEVLAQEVLKRLKLDASG